MNRFNKLFNAQQATLNIFYLNVSRKSPMSISVTSKTSPILNPFSSISFFSCSQPAFKVFTFAIKFNIFNFLSSQQTTVKVTTQLVVCTAHAQPDVTSGTLSIAIHFKYLAILYTPLLFEHDNYTLILTLKKQKQRIFFICFYRYYKVKKLENYIFVIFFNSAQTTACLFTLNSISA